MKNILLLCLSVSALLLSSGCSSSQKQSYDYSNLIQSNPKTILVMMPTSLATDVNAGPAVLASTVIPLSERGYYPIPVTLANDTFKYNGVNIADEIHQIPINKLHEIFGADAGLYIHIKDYKTQYQLLDSVTIVTVQAQLYDLKNGNLLWQNAVSINNADTHNSNILAQLIGAVIKHIVNNVSDKEFQLAQENAVHLYYSNTYPPLLYGPKSPYYRTENKQ